MLVPNTLAPSLRPGAADIASLTRIPPGLGNDGKWQRGNVQKRVAYGLNSVGTRFLRPGSMRVALVLIK